MMSTPGIVIMSELGEIERFYARLAPKVEQSVEHVRYGLWGSTPPSRKTCKGLPQAL